MCWPITSQSLLRFIVSTAVQIEELHSSIWTSVDLNAPEIQNWNSCLGLSFSFLVVYFDKETFRVQLLQNENWTMTHMTQQDALLYVLVTENKKLWLAGTFYVLPSILPKTSAGLRRTYSCCLTVSSYIWLFWSTTMTFYVCHRVPRSASSMMTYSKRMSTSLCASLIYASAMPKGCLRATKWGQPPKLAWLSPWLPQWPFWTTTTPASSRSASAWCAWARA